MFGLIAAMGGRIWVENKVDFSSPRNLITIAAALTAGAADLTLKFGAFEMGGSAPQPSAPSSSIRFWPLTDRRDSVPRRSEKPAGSKPVGVTLCPSPIVPWTC